MAKKQTIVSEISSALGAVAAKAEQLIAKTPARKTVKKTEVAAAPAPKAVKPAAKRTTSAKHSKVTPKVSEPKAVETVVTPTIAPVEITHEQIAQQAYLYWEARGYQGGNPAEDWARAEAELKQRAMAAKA